MKYFKKLTEIYVSIDEFYKTFNHMMKKYQLNPIHRRRNRKFNLSGSEVMTILVLFHLSDYRHLKHFYLFYVQKHLRSDFPKTVSYNRFVELAHSVIFPLALYLKKQSIRECTGISFVDSTPLRVCHNRRIHSHKVFKGIAERGHCSIGWFFGFKLHIIINDKGELLNFVLTQANVDDREPLIAGNMLKQIWGKLFGDKGYISQSLFNTLFVSGIHLITKIRKNMRNTPMNMTDKILLRKRALIESVNDELKNICQIEHSRHRSVINFLTNLLAGLIAYCFLPKKPRIKCEFENSNQLAFC